MESWIADWKYIMPFRKMSESPRGIGLRSVVFSKNDAVSGVVPGAGRQNTAAKTRQRIYLKISGESATTFEKYFIKLHTQS